MDKFLQFDGNLLIGIQSALYADWLTPIMKFITWFGEGGYFWIACCILLLCFKRTRRIGIMCTLALMLTFICCNLVIKPWVDRTRPWVVFEAVNRLIADPGDPSFPSGHSANAMGPAWALYLATRKDENQRAMHKLGIAGVVLALFIGLSRLYLGVHFPTDVLGGLILGIICATIVYLAVTRFEAKHDRLICGDKFKSE